MFKIPGANECRGTGHEDNQRRNGRWIAEAPIDPSLLDSKCLLHRILAAPENASISRCYVPSALTQIKVQFVPPPRITLEYMCRCRTRQRALPPKATIRGIPAAPGSRTEVVSEVGRIAVQTPPRAVATPRGIVCSSPPRYRSSVSTCAAKVRASLLKARSALSSSPPLDFLILEKWKPSC